MPSSSPNPSLHSWRYCVGARLKFWQRSCVPKKGSRDEAVVKSHSTMLQRLRCQISLDYYTIPPATQAIQILTLFQTKKCHFSHPFSDLEVVTKLNITCLHKTKIMSSLLRLKPQQRDLLKSISNLRITLSF